MKLVDRLKKPYLEKLQLANIKYPSKVGEVFEELEEKEFWTNLRFGTWSSIQLFTCAEHPADIFTDNL
jgi:hypothetical protein